MRPTNLDPEKGGAALMTLILELPDEQEIALKQKAQAQGVSTEQDVQQVLTRELSEPLAPAPRGRPSRAFRFGSLPYRKHPLCIASTTFFRGGHKITPT
jgi:plasmid stability protein